MIQMTKGKTKAKPLFIGISDLHFNLNTLTIASECLERAIVKASELKVNLIVAGDLHDHKGNIRAEVANTLLNLFQYAADMDVISYVLVGNHDKINEKGDPHGLNYLSHLTNVVSTTTTVPMRSKTVALLPYFSEPENLIISVENLQPDSPDMIVMHQGIRGAAMGDYVIDKTSVEASLFAKYPVFSGHYHRHQTVGTVTYFGNPYTLTFGEANDGEKGFLIVYDDGTFQREILHLRRHVVLDLPSALSTIQATGLQDINPDDLLWLKLHGPASELAKIKKSDLSALLACGGNFKLDFIADKTMETETISEANLTEGEMLDALIDQTPETQEQKQQLKTLWKELVS